MRINNYYFTLLKEFYSSKSRTEKESIFSTSKSYKTLISILLYSTWCFMLYALIAGFKTNTLFSIIFYSIILLWLLYTITNIVYGTNLFFYNSKFFCRQSYLKYNIIGFDEIVSYKILKENKGDGLDFLYIIRKNDAIRINITGFAINDINEIKETLDKIVKNASQKVKISNKTTKKSSFQNLKSFDYKSLKSPLVSMSIIIIVVALAKCILRYVF